MQLQYFLSIDALITGVIALFFGFIVIRKNRKNIINITGFLLTIATAFWSLGYWKWLSVLENEVKAIFWIKFLTIGSFFIPLFYFHWITSLLELNIKKRKQVIFFYFLVIIFLFLFFLFPSLFVKETYSTNIFSFWPRAGILYSFYLFFIYFTLVVYSIFLLIKQYINSHGTKREQSRYVLIGSILGFGGGATNFFLWYDINVLPIGNVLVVLYPILFTYSIIKHRFMDIRFVLRKSSVYLASLVSVLVPYLVVKFVFYSLAPDTVYWADFLMLIIALALFPGLKDYYFRLANRYFFSSLYDSKKVIAQLSDKLKATLETRKIFEIISETMVESMRVKEVSMFSYNTRLKRYILQGDKKTEMDIDVKKDFSTMAEKIISDHGHPIIIEEIKRVFYKDNKAAIDFFNSLGVEILVPLNVKDKKIGLIALGQKESGDIYNDEDMEVLNVIGSQAAIALENALLYEETASFNIKLKKEIEKATSDLRSANEELKKLDEAKSEFISIASHQLRTPLTAIKGYVSMILEGDFGKPAVKNVPPLKNVFESSERLIKLIENLLNISRIESGRIKYEFKIIQLEDMVASVISELEQVAQKKNIKLIYKAPTKSLPKIKVDEEKIRQVVMNIVDNAVKYTNEGSVEVKLGFEGGNIKFCVSDTGMGIKKEDLPNLFKKFSRGSGTFLVHTEGTGLGLYVARQMIEMHKGKVWAESKGEGKGSSFIFLLPVAGKNAK